MLPQNLFGFKVKTTESPITSFSGIPVLATLAHSLGIHQRLSSKLHLRQRDRGYDEADKVLSLGLLLAAGGERLSDIRVLLQDQGLKRVLGNSLPSGVTLSNFLRSFDRQTLRALTRINNWFARHLIELLGITKVTIDADATLIESQKKEAKKTYKGFRGYDPLIASLARYKIILTGLFRPGNAAPGGNALSFLKRILRILPSGLKIRIRSDSAWYNAYVMDHADDHGVQFAITADMDVSTKATIKAIPEKDWDRFSKRKPKEYQIAETVHSLNNSDRAYRLIVVREPREQLDLFEEPYIYRAIISNTPDHSGRAVFRWHRKKGDGENVIKEGKGGFAMDKLPCGSLLANAAYFQIALLAYNLVQAWKLLTLPESWHHYTIKTLRFRLLNVAGVVVNHARQLALKLPRGQPFFDIFYQSRMRTIGLAVE